MTEELFREDSYLKECSAKVVRVTPEGVVLDRTVFYPEGGGQPGDHGTLLIADGSELAVTDTKSLEDRAILHVVSGGVSPTVTTGIELIAKVDWTRRHRLMRMHTLLHVLCGVVPEKVTGASVRANGTGRLDFDVAEPRLDKDVITAELNRLIEAAVDTKVRWITDDALERDPDLVRTMSVRPPQGQGRVRLLEIPGVDLQACGGTHVANTVEIGAARVTKVEKKGKRNRRVNVAFVEGD